MVKYLFLLVGLTSQALAQSDNERSHILQCRAQRDSLSTDATENKTIASAGTEITALNEADTLQPNSMPEHSEQSTQLASSTQLDQPLPEELPPEEVVITLVNPTREQRAMLSEPTFPAVKNSVFDPQATDETQPSTSPQTQPFEKYEVFYEFEFSDGLLRPQLEKLTRSFFPEFSVSWDNYHIPYRWQGHYLLKGDDRWALLNRVVESFAITVTVNGNYVMEFNAKQEQQ